LKSRILITGSEGVIGKILSGNLKEYEIIKLDKKVTNQINYINVDISNYENLESEIKYHLPIDTVIHLAADHRVNANWNSVLNNNIVGTRNIYECARKFNFSKIIFFSSNHVTGGYEGFPPKLHLRNDSKLITIKSPIRPDSYYASGKVFGEALARQFHELYDIDSICLRIGTVLENNNPDLNKRTLKTWLSHNDLINLTKKSMTSNVKFGIYYGVSNNSGKFWDISNAIDDLDYSPQDNACNE